MSRKWLLVLLLLPLLVQVLFSDNNSDGNGARTVHQNPAPEKVSQRPQWWLSVM
ncbi:MAG: hypothetical protein ACJAUN_001479 [Alcanivorax sp.]|jgi:hypothetical protein|uniref:hypothetical protein n=1 Tax=Alcanivorax TaxID=59753 RepID=UPI0035678DD2